MADRQPWSYHEAYSNTHKFYKGKLKGQDASNFKTNFRASLAMNPTLFEAVKPIIFEKLEKSKKHEKVQIVLDLVIWVLLLDIPLIKEYCASKIDIIRNLAKRFSITGHTHWKPLPKPTDESKLNLHEKISYLESLLQFPHDEQLMDKFAAHTNSSALGNPNSNFQRCLSNHSSPRSNFMYEIKECGHFICEPCLKTNCVESLKQNNVFVRCPLDHALINRETILSVLNEFEAQHYAVLVQENHAQNSMFQTVPCPKCSKQSYLEGVLLAECQSCDFVFCTNCGENFHGNTKCVELTFRKSSIENKQRSMLKHEESLFMPEKTTEEEVSDLKFKHNTEVSVSAIEAKDENINASNICEEFGALAKPHELGFPAKNDGYSLRDSEFYAGEFRENIASFSSEEIDVSFQSSFVTDKNNTLWPWELMDAHRLENQEFVAPFNSLNNGQWIEDTILETAMERIVADAGLGKYVVVLESYVMRWALQKVDHYQNNVFSSLVREKDLLGKSLIVALLNTDSAGCGGHWMLGLVDLRRRSIMLMDSSIVVSNTFYRKFFFGLLHAIHVAQEMVGAEEENWKTWELVVGLNSVQQSNNADCGAIVVANLYTAIQKEILRITPESAQLRRWLHEIVSSREKDTNYTNADAENNMDVDAKNEDTPNIQTTAFSPKGLRYSYRDIQEFISEIDFTKSQN